MNIVSRTIATKIHTIHGMFRNGRVMPSVVNPLKPTAWPFVRMNANARVTPIVPIVVMSALMPTTVTRKAFSAPMPAPTPSASSTRTATPTERTSG